MQIVTLTKHGGGRNKCSCHKKLQSFQYIFRGN